MSQPTQLLTANQLVHVNRQYEMAKSNMKVDLTNLPCPAHSKVIGEILLHHSLLDALTVSASFLIIYMQQMWNTLLPTDSKDTFKYTIDQEEVTFSVNDLRTVVNFSQVTDNDHVEFVEPSEFLTIVKFLNIIGHEVSIHLLGQFYTKHLPQPWQTLCKVLSLCLTSMITGID
ncbi:hypothetical protein Tco_1013369 [Tanacetum coccineum]